MGYIMPNRHERRAAPVIHRKKLFGGRFTAEEIHAKHAFPPGAKCSGCGGPPMIRAMVMAPLDEVKKRDPEFEVLEQLATVSPEAAQRWFKMLVQIKGSDGKPVPHIRLITAYACQSCGPTMEKTLAKGPSWCIVEINRGPGRDRVITSG